jgi:hypothetical protein
MDLPKFICKRVISMTLVKSINLVVIFRFVVISFFSRSGDRLGSVPANRAQESAGDQDLGVGVVLYDLT